MDVRASILVLFAFLPAAAKAEPCPQSMVWNDFDSEEVWSCERSLRLTGGAGHFECTLGLAHWEGEFDVDQGRVHASASGSFNEACGARAEAQLHTRYTVAGAGSAQTSVVIRAEVTVTVSLDEFGLGFGLARGTVRALDGEIGLDRSMSGSTTQELELSVTASAGESFDLVLEAHGQASIDSSATTDLTLLSVAVDSGFELIPCEGCTTVRTQPTSWSQLKGAFGPTH